MKQVSFEDMGSVVVTFAAQEGMENKGQVVKMTANGQVGPCGAGEQFCGVALSGKGEFAAVQVKGFVETAVTGEVGLGWVKLSADGSGGVKADSNGRECLVVEYDSTAGAAVLCL